MVTFDKNNKPHSRPMTNLNDNPYSTMWFPTYTNTRKVHDIKQNPKTLILFPEKEKQSYYEVEGHASFASEEVVDEKWVWWYLYWHPEQEKMFWFDPSTMHVNKTIIDVHPVSIKTISMKDIDYIHETYETILPKSLETKHES